MKVSRILYWIAFLALLATPVLIALYFYSSTDQSTDNPDIPNNQDIYHVLYAITHVEDVYI